MHAHPAPTHPSRRGVTSGRVRAVLVASVLAVTAPLLAAPPAPPAAPPNNAGRPAPQAPPASGSAAVLPPLPCRASTVKGGPLRLRSRERVRRVRECQNTAAAAEREVDLPGDDKLEGLFADGSHYKPGARVRSLEPSVRGWVAAARELPPETVEALVQYTGTRRESWGPAARFSVAVTLHQAEGGMCHDWVTTEKLHGQLVLRETDGAIVSMTLTGLGQRTEATCRSGATGKGPALLCSTSQLDVTLDRACPP